VFVTPGSILHFFAAIHCTTHGLAAKNRTVRCLELVVRLHPKKIPNVKTSGNFINH